MENTEQNGQTTLEEKFEQLEGLIDTLSREDVSLEDAFTAYSKGMEVLKECSTQIDTVEKKVLYLNSQGNLEELPEL